MAAVYPGSHNVFVRSHDASNKLVVDFARNISDFALNKYCQVVPVKKVGGYYLRMTVEEAARILSTDGRNFLWPDGQPAPEGNEGLESFEYFPFECNRYAPTFLLGDLTIDQADWNILAQHARIKAQQLMTLRTQLVVTQFTTSGNYAANHYINVLTISGNTGTWAASTTARQDIKRSIETAIEVILDDTNNGVKMDDLRLVINSSLAAKISRCQEIVDYVKSSPFSLPMLRGELPGSDSGFYNLPAKLYGIDVVVEATRKVTTKKGATTTRSQILTESTPFICARPGGLVGLESGPNFSTACLFAHTEMAVETIRDEDNKRTKGRVIDIVDARVVAPASGVLFYNAT